MANNWNRNMFSIEDKLSALTRLREGESATKIARDLGVQTSALIDWHISCAVPEQVNKALFMWFTQCTSKGLSVSGPTLQEKALQLNKEMGNKTDFHASDDWLEKWKNQYGVRKISLSTDKKHSEEWNTLIHEVLEEEGVSGDQSSKCSKSGLQIKLLQNPHCNLSSKEKVCVAGFKHNKTRVNILDCSNVTGNNQILMVNRSSFYLLSLDLRYLAHVLRKIFK